MWWARSAWPLPDPPSATPAVFVCFGAPYMQGHECGLPSVRDGRKLTFMKIDTRSSVSDSADTRLQRDKSQVTGLARSPTL